MQPAEVRAIGVHGQTIRHRPELGFTRQTNNPALLAELTGIDVIADFRSRDVAAGGQGAPLVPAFHQARLRPARRDARGRQHRRHRQYQRAARATAAVAGFDTGPGNVLMDAWIVRHQASATTTTAPGPPAAQVQPALLERLLAEPYFALPPPKSTGRDLFHPDGSTRT